MTMTSVLSVAIGVSLLFGYISQWALRGYYKRIEKDLRHFKAPKKRLTKQIRIKFDTALSFGKQEPLSDESTKALVRNGMNHYRLIGLSFFRLEHLWCFFGGICMIPGIAAWIADTFFREYVLNFDVSADILLTAGILSVLSLAVADRFFDNSGLRARLTQTFADMLSLEKSERTAGLPKQGNSSVRNPERNAETWGQAAMSAERDGSGTSSENTGNRRQRERHPADPNEQLVAEMMDYFSI